MRKGARTCIRGNKCMNLCNRLINDIFDVNSVAHEAACLDILKLFLLVSDQDVRYSPVEKLFFDHINK